MWNLKHSGQEDIFPMVCVNPHVQIKKALFITKQSHSGFALAMVLVLGMVMIPMAVASIMVAQQDRNSAVQRKDLGASRLVSDSAIARAMIQLSKPNNGVLLIRNYDPINSQTGKNYLGVDGISDNGDETGTAIDQWTGYTPSNAPCFQQVGRGKPNIALTGAIGSDESYIIRAYRYDPQKKLGTLLVEGNYKGQTSKVALTLSIMPVLDDFPGVLAEGSNVNTMLGKVVLRGRSILGRYGNLYYTPASSADPSLGGISSPGDTTRSSYLKAIWSGPLDGNSSDRIDGKIFACALSPQIPMTSQGPNLGTISTSMTLSGSAGQITSYQLNHINLGNNDALTVDTTAGPVYLYLTPDSGTIILRHTAKILNIRTDGQPPRVGDLRIMNLGSDFAYTQLYDQSCIQNAFLYYPEDDLQLFTSGPGCPGGKNSNFEGVAWVEELYSSKNNTSNQYVNTDDPGTMNTLVTTGATSGITVSDDVSSLVDLLEYIDWPVRYKYGSVKNWQRVN